jgi:hypothetical protein
MKVFDKPCGKNLRRLDIDIDELMPNGGTYSAYELREKLMEAASNLNRVADDIVKPKPQPPTFGGFNATRNPFDFKFPHNQSVSSNFGCREDREPDGIDAHVDRPLRQNYPSNGSFEHDMRLYREFERAVKKCDWPTREPMKGLGEGRQVNRQVNDFKPRCEEATPLMDVLFAFLFA